MNTIKCPHCGKSVEISEALKHQFEEKTLAEINVKHAKELEKAKKLAEEKALQKITEDMSLKMKDKENEAREAKERMRKQQEEMLALNKLMREMREKDQQRELEMEKKLALEETRIRQETQKKAEEELHLKMLAKDKQLADTLKELEDARRKLQQGSQQTQGEVFELEFEELLKRQYPNDKILPVGKGIRGADVIQEVWDARGNFTGKILWELKNTKTWSEGWVEKLKGDKRTINAEEAVLITEVMPTSIKNAGWRDGIWVTQQSFVIPLADTLRAKAIQLFYIRNSVKAKDEKMEILYSYLSGTEFKHRVEAIIDAFTNMQEEIEKEKRYFTNKWARDEKNIRQVIDNTYGMHGDMKGIIGQMLPQIKGIDLLGLSEGKI